MATADRVLVTGMGIVSPFGGGVESARNGLRSGRDCSGRVGEIDPLGCRGTRVCPVPAGALGVGLAEGKIPPWLDRATLLLLAALDEALAAAGAEGELGAGPRFVFGTTLGGMESGRRYHQAFLAGQPARSGPLLDYLTFSQPLSVLLQKRGTLRPWVVSNACASGTSALGLAYRLIASGRETFVLAAGYDPMSAFTFWGFNAMRLVSADRCRPFDARRDGLLLGEGAAVFVLESKRRAESRGASILGEILGYGESNDAHHATHPDPSGRGAARAMAMALAETGLAPTDLDYINAHGTGTRANDAAEVAAIRVLCGKRAGGIPVSSTKGGVGHCLGAAGALEAAFTLIALGHDFLPHTVNLSTPDPEFGLDFVVGSPRARQAEVALSNSFGFGGMNSSLLLRRGEVAP